MATKAVKPFERAEVTIDATGMTYGRLASKVAKELMAKNTPGFSYAIDKGSIVKVINIKHVKFTGNKMTQKKYYHHSRYQGGLKTRGLNEMFKDSPAKMLRHTVERMLPKNTFRIERLKRLTVR